MRFSTDPEPITDDDATIRAQLDDAPVPVLLATVAHLTGDHTLLRPDLRPDLARVLLPNAGYTDDQVTVARERCTAALARHRDAGSPPPAPLDDAQLRTFVEFMAGSPVDDEYLPLLEEELALDGADLRAPRWHADEIAPGRTFRVVVIGAGMSGILVAHRLRQAGIDVEILEKNAEVGGTWLENDYPGCRVDIQNHFYSYACAQTSDWPEYHSRQPVLLEYFRACVEQFGLRDAIRFGTEVVEARWDDEAAEWRLVTSDASGARREERAHAVVSAVGQLNRPLLPDIEGIDRFAGPWFHSARWRHDVELRGRRVGVIGTGASAAQFVPAIAPEVEHLTVFQRTPPWLLPVPTYEDPVPASLRWLLRHAPDYARWDRLWIFARTQEGLLPMATVDPAWDDGGRSVSARNRAMRDMLTAYYEVAFPDPDLRAAVLPDYPPTAKRVVLDAGTLPRALQRPNVDLVTASITEIIESGLRTDDGVEHELDVIIYGTGFHASKFLTPMEVHGEHGADLHATWGGDARAYLGITIPQFPNLFLMYGPNTNIVINGSIIYFSECEATYIVESVRLLLERGLRSMTCRQDVHDDYGARIDAGNQAMAWGVAGVHSWYKNEFGRVAQNWPFNLFEYWRLTRRPDPDDYVLR